MYADRALLNNEINHPFPNDKTLNKMRLSFLNLIGCSKEKTDEVILYLNAIQWSPDEKDFIRLNLETPSEIVLCEELFNDLKNKVAKDFMEFRLKMRELSKSISSVYYGILNNQEYKDLKEKFKSTMVAFVKKCDLVFQSNINTK